MINKIKQQLKKQFTRENVIFWIFAILVGGIITLTKIILPVAKNGVHQPLDIFNLANLLLFTGSAILARGLITAIYHRLSKKNKSSKLHKSTFNQRKCFLGVFALCLLFWGITFVIFFPGVAMNDTIATMDCFLCTSFHPPLFSMITYIVYHAGVSLFGSGTAGFAVVAVLQLITASLITAFFINWVNKKGCPKWGIIILVLFFTLTPLINDYAIAVLKDSWFAFSFLLLLPNFFDLITMEKCNKKTIFFFSLGIIGIIGSRSNGFLIAIIILLILFISKFKTYKKYLVGFSVGIIALQFILSSLLSYHQFDTNTSFRETIAIPLDQVAATLAYNGDILNEEDAEVIYNILPYNKWTRWFSFSYIDNIKYLPEFNNDYLNQHKKDFLMIWAKLAFQYPDSYIKAFLYQTFGIWNVAFWETELMDESQSVFTSVDNNIRNSEGWQQLLQERNLHNKNVLPDGMSGWVQGIYAKGITLGLSLSSGVLFIILLGCCAMLLCIRKYKILAVLLPVIICWLTMLIATPASMMYRYNLYLLITIPFILFITISSLHKNNNLATGKQKL